MCKFDQNLFREFLNLYWLRPENGALLYYQSQSWSDVAVSNQSLDISTGDGTFVFLHCGGKFHEDFDFFNSTLADEFSHNSFVDIYNSISDQYKPLILKEPTVRFTYGTDWKASLVERAKALRFFDHVIQHDNNILPLPFEDNQFKFVHSNAICWTKNSKALLLDIHRILERDGYAALEFCTSRVLSTLEKLQTVLTPSALSILDRKRSGENKVLNVDCDDWTAWIKEAGFRIVDLRAAWPNQVITDFWNIGTRPVSHLLIQMSKRLSSEEYRSIKREWVDIFMELLVPLCEKPEKFDAQHAPYITYILKK